MTCPYDNHLELVRQLRELGAVEITVGEVRVRFPETPLSFAGLPAEGRSPADILRELNAQPERDPEAEFEEILFHSSDAGYLEP